MRWSYVQANGNLVLGGELVYDSGYSGFAAGKNNPAAESQTNVGPIPRGRYSIGSPFDSQQHGPVVMHLQPEDGTDTFGRGGFLIHGDSSEHPGMASHGCIVLPRSVRLRIAASGCKELEVV